MSNDLDNRLLFVARLAHEPVVETAGYTVNVSQLAGQAFDEIARLRAESDRRAARIVALQEAVEAWKAEVAEWKENFRVKHENLERLAAESGTKDAKIERLRALAEYAEHQGDCRVGTVDDAPCSCGLDALRREADRELQQEMDHKEASRQGRA